MRRRTLLLLLAVGLLAAACGGQAAEFRARPSEFVPQVVDFLDDVGRSPSIAVDQEGNPYLAYLGFTAELAPGEVPPPRPIGAPELPAVLYATLNQGIWSRAAIQEKAKITPAASTAAIAVDAQGTVHVAWTDAKGLSYATGQGGTFSTSRVATGKLTGASIAVDPAGTPWVAYYQGNSVRTATKAGDAWTTEQVGTVGAGETLPVRTAVQVQAGEPLIAFADPESETPMLATRSGGAWSLQPIERGGGGFGISLALDAAGSPHVAYYTAGGEVRHASSQGAGPWQTGTVASSTGSTAGGEETTGWSTAIAVDGEGVRSVAWYDPGTRGIRFAREQDGSFAAQDVPAGEGGTSPAIAAAPEGGRIYVAWYDAVNRDLQMATYGGTLTLLAQPSPSPSASVFPVSPAPSPGDGGGGGECPADPTLSIAAPPGATATGFDQTQLSAPSGKALEVCFDNQDEGVPHNWAVWSEDPLANPAAKSLFDPGATITGIAETVYNVPALDAGSYFYRCDVHPTTMTGTLQVK